MVNTVNTFNTLRISGLASGIDTESIIKNLMAAERIPVDKLKQNKQILQWQQEDYRTINNSLRTFRDKVFNMKLQATYLTKKASSSNEAAVKATASATAVDGLYTINVTQLATGASATSASQLVQSGDPTKTVDPTQPLNTQFATSGTYTFTINGSNSITIDPATDTLNSVIDKINSATKPDGSAIGVKASYDQTLGRVFLNTPATGADQSISISNSTGDFFTDVFKIDPTQPYQGQNAIFTLNNVAFKEPTNTFTIAGVTYELRQAGASANVTVSSDTDAIFNAIKDFVSAYNDVIAQINSKLSETRHSDYPPLTDDQRAAMSADEIKKWEDMARSGLLQNDPLLDGIVNTMRLSMATIVPGLTGGQYNTLSSIGITTGLYEEKGKLYIDETKLRDAIQKDPNGVMNLFTKSADSYSDKGIAARLYDDVNNAITQISQKAGSDSTFTLADNSYIGQRLRDIDNNIYNMEDRLKQVEDRYYRQFTAMEQAINQMNAQSAWLSQQLGMGAASR